MKLIGLQPCPFIYVSQLQQKISSLAMLKILSNWLFFFFFKLYIIVLVLPNIKMNPHRYTCVPPPEPSSLLPPHTIPLGRPSAPAPSIQDHALSLDWRLVSYMILYNIMFQYYMLQYFNAILPNLPTLSLSHRVQKTVLYISVSFAVSYTGLLLASF